MCNKMIVEDTGAVTIPWWIYKKRYLKKKKAQQILAVDYISTDNKINVEKQICYISGPCFNLLKWDGSFIIERIVATLTFPSKSPLCFSH